MKIQKFKNFLFEIHKDLRSEIGEIFKEEERDYNEIIDIISWSDEIPFEIEISASISFKTKNGYFISTNIYRTKQIKNIIEEIYNKVIKVSTFDPSLGTIGNINADIDETLKCWRGGNHNLILYLNGPNESMEWVKIRKSLIKKIRSYLPNLNIDIISIGSIKISWK